MEENDGCEKSGGRYDIAMIHTYCKTIHKNPERIYRMMDEKKKKT